MSIFAQAANYPNKIMSELMGALAFGIGLSGIVMNIIRIVILYMS